MAMFNHHVLTDIMRFFLSDLSSRVTSLQIGNPNVYIGYSSVDM
jgi:hypothetical protein